MKLITRFKNKYSNITYSLYELNDSAILIHLLNPATINFDFVLLHKAGSIYENMEKKNHGTAHLLEHMMMNPNTSFKTQDDIYKFQEGNKDRPALGINAVTGHKHLCVVGYANQKAWKRIIERIESAIDFPFDIFKTSFENEKRIVSAERSRRPKLEKDPFLQRLIFLEGKEAPEFTHNIVGELDDIKAISLYDLKTYFEKRILIEKPLFVIQSNKRIDRSTTQMLEQISKKYGEGHAIDNKIPKLKNELELGYYYDERATGTAIELNYFWKLPKKTDYAYEACLNVLNSIIRKIAQVKLREEMGIIYSCNTFAEGWCTTGYYVYGSRFVIENTRLKEMLEVLRGFLFDDIEKFIQSPQGTRWINNILSTYIYPNTVAYDQELPYQVAKDFSDTGELYNHNLYIKEVKKITKKKLIEMLHNIQRTSPHIWIESNLQKEEIEKSVKTSSLWKTYFK